MIFKERGRDFERGICKNVRQQTDLVFFQFFSPVNLPKNMFITSKIDEILRIRG